MKITINVDDKLIDKLIKSTRVVKRSFMYEKLFSSIAEKYLEAIENMSDEAKADLLTNLQNHIKIGGLYD